jgi:hypothetical protein
MANTRRAATALVIIALMIMAYIMGDISHDNVNPASNSDHVADYNDGWTDGQNDLLEQGYRK